VAKSKVPPKKKEAEDKPATKPTTGGAPPAKPSPASRREIESVSLIDEKKPRQKLVDGEVKKKTAVLPPISRIRASMEAAPAPLKEPPAEVPKVESPRADVDLAAQVP